MAANGIWCSYCQRYFHPNVDPCPHWNPHGRSNLAQAIQALLVCAAVMVAIGAGFSWLFTISKPQPPRESPSFQLSPKAKVSVNFPELLFLPMAKANALIGKPNVTLKTTTLMSWSEGPIHVTRFVGGSEASYFNGRLYGLKYRFPPKKRPETFEAALEAVGLPGESVALDTRRLDGHLNLLDSPNWKNPLRFGGLLFHTVAIPSDMSHVEVLAININEHFADWLPEMQTAWKTKGLAVSKGKSAKWCVVPIPGGSILNAPTYQCEVPSANSQ